MCAMASRWKNAACASVLLFALGSARAARADDQHWLAFRGKHYTGWLIHPDGRDLHRIPRPNDVATVVPWEWSPDGRRLAYYGYLKGAGGGGGADYGIFVSGADGSGLIDI